MNWSTAVFAFVVTTNLIMVNLHIIWARWRLHRLERNARLLAKLTLNHCQRANLAPDWAVLAANDQATLSDLADFRSFYWRK